MFMGNPTILKKDKYFTLDKKTFKMLFTVAEKKWF